MIKIEINYQVKVPESYEALFKKISRLVCRKTGKRKKLVISVGFIGAKKIRQLNKRYRGLNKVTDVLSFPEINEILLCYAQAKKQAKVLKQSLKEQIGWLFCHGLLHLLGFNHQTKKQQKKMRRLEKAILSEI